MGDWNLRGHDNSNQRVPCHDRWRNKKDNVKRNPEVESCKKDGLEWAPVPIDKYVDKGARRAVRVLINVQLDGRD